MSTLENHNRLEKLRQRAEMVNAADNYFDTVNDILRWPQHIKHILHDLENAISAREEKAEEYQND